MTSVGKRLQEERKRLKISQADFGKIGGCGRTTQVRYESDESSPTVDYLEKIAQVGADTIYIVSGLRQGTTKYSSPLEPLEVVVDVQQELGLSFNAEQIRNLSGLVYTANLDREQLKEVVQSSYKFHGLNIGDSNLK